MDRFFFQQGIKSSFQKKKGKRRVEKRKIQRSNAEIALIDPVWLHNDEWGEIMGNDVFFGTFLYTILILCEP